jgi:hypothetical protein
MADGALWLNIVFGEVTRQRPNGGDDAAPAPAQGPPACPCGLGLGDLRLIPEVAVSVHVPEGHSVLLAGLKWRAGQEGLAAPANEALLLVPRVTPVPAVDTIAQPD